MWRFFQWIELGNIVVKIEGEKKYVLGVGTGSNRFYIELQACRLVILRKISAESGVR